MNLHGAAWLILDDLTGEVQALCRSLARLVLILAALILAETTRYAQIRRSLRDA